MGYELGPEDRGAAECWVEGWEQGVGRVWQLQNVGFGEVTPSSRSQGLWPWLGLVTFSFADSGLPAADCGGQQRSLISVRLSSTALANLVEEVSLQLWKLEMQKRMLSGWGL